MERLAVTNLTGKLFAVGKKISGFKFTTKKYFPFMQESAEKPLKVHVPVFIRPA